MKKIFVFLLFSLFFCSFVLAVPQYINYQGALKNSAGSLESGTFSMVFKIYDAASAGTAVYNSAGTATSVAVANGIYNVELGTVDSTIFTGADRWLEVAVAGETLTPRLKINSVGYAIMASSAEAATTATIASYATLSGTATNAGTVDNLHASTTATANQLYPLDANTRLSGIAVSAEANSGFALFINGRLGGSDAGSGGGASPGTVGIVGKATLPTGVASVTVYNPNVKTTSYIFVTPYDNDANSSADSLRVQPITSDGQFTVRTWTGAAPSDNDVDFVYLVIN